MRGTNEDELCDFVALTENKVHVQLQLPMSASWLLTLLKQNMSLLQMNIVS